jgi:chromatin remodeling complex protein RSC6
MELEDQFNQLNDCLSLFKIQLGSLQKLVQKLEKDVKKEITKKTKDTKEPKKQRKPSGFAKPRKVSDALCEFMNVPLGSEIARTTVTKNLVNYIKKNKLAATKNKIIPDQKLLKLLEIENEEDIHNLTYFTMQKYMNKHFCVKD